MKNFEKYEKEIKEAVEYDEVIETIMKLSNSKYCGISKIVGWLYEEYKEPSLSDECKNYLKAIIDPLKENFDYIEVEPNNLMRIHFTLGEFISLYLPLSLNLNSLEKHKHYTLEELGLWK